jgi:hypothetical protein
MHAGEREIGLRAKLKYVNVNCTMERTFSGSI